MNTDAAIKNIRARWLCIAKTVYECRSCGVIRTCTIDDLLATPECSCNA